MKRSRKEAAKKKKKVIVLKSAAINLRSFRLMLSLFFKAVVSLSLSLFSEEMVYQF